MNELLFFIVMLSSLALVLFTVKLGREWLFVTPVFLIILANVFAPQLCLVFGVTTSLALPLYAAIFLATDIISEHWGKREARKVVWMGLFAMAVLVLFSQLIIRVDVLSFSQPLNAALKTIFAFTPRIALGSAIAYIISQNYDVWIFHFLKQRFRGKHIWLRNNISTITSQLLDSSIFILIAFYGLVPGFIELILGVWLLKILVALIDTPFIYLSYALVDKKVRRVRPVLNEV